MSKNNQNLIAEREYQRLCRETPIANGAFFSISKEKAQEAISNAEKTLNRFEAINHPELNKGRKAYKMMEERVVKEEWERDQQDLETARIAIKGMIYARRVETSELLVFSTKTREATDE